MRTWVDVTRKEPCQICGRGDWCRVSTDGAWAICRRLQRDGAITKHDKNSSEFYLYPLDGQAPHKPAVSTPDVLAARLADVATRDRIYRALLGELGLSQKHRGDLEQRGLSGAHILAGDYGTMPEQGRARMAQRLVEQFGPYDCAGVSGLYVASEGTRRWWSLAGMPGLLIPVRDVDGRIMSLKIRADGPDDGPRYTTLSSRKYGGPGPGALCHVPLHTGLAADTVRLTEGELKSDASTALSGVLTLGIPGVVTWRTALPILEALQPQTVLLAWDADWRRNPAVACSLADAALELTSQGFHVQIEYWCPDQGKGVDDVLAAGHVPEWRHMTYALAAKTRGLSGSKLKKERWRHG